MKKRVISLVLIFAMLGMLVQGGRFGTTVYAYPTNYPNTHTNTGNQLEDIIAVAETQIGYTYSSGTKYGAWYGSSFTTSAWCAMFVSWCANEAGIPTSVIPRHASCDVGMNWFKNNNRWHNGAYYGGSYSPRRGDIVYYSDSYSQSDSTHVGIVTGLSGSYLQVIEGNTDSKVHKYTQNAKRTLSNGYVLGYGTPNYNAAPVSHTRDTSYGTNFTATAKVKIDVFNADHTDPGNYYIEPGDVCTIHEVYTDGCCRVTYPSSIAPGGTRTYYCKFNSANFQWSNPVTHTRDTSYGTNFTATARVKIDIFNEDHTDPGNYYIDAGDVCTIHEVYTDGCCKVTYPSSISSTGTRTAYCKFNSANFQWSTPVTHTRDTSYGTDFTAKAKVHIDVFNADHTDPGDYYIDAGDVCTIHEVYTDGCCKVTYPSSISSSGTRTAYCKFNSANFEWGTAFSLTFSPSSLAVTEGESAVVNLKFAGDGIHQLAFGIGNESVCAATFNGTDWSAGTSSITVTGKSAGSTTITVSFLNSSGSSIYSKSFNVTVKAKQTAFSLTFSPSSLTVTEGESAVVNLKFAGDGIHQLAFGIGNESVCAATFNGTDWGAGTSSITVTGKSAGSTSITVYFLNESGSSIYSKSFNVTVNQPSLSSIAVKSKPSKLTYTAGETLATSGLKLTATYSDGSTKEITSGFTCSPAALNTVGTQKITVTYGGKTTSFDVTVRSRLAIVTQPSDVSAKAGDSISFTVKAQGDSLSYQWYYKKSGQTSWSQWSGRTTATITAVANATWDGMQVYCKVTDGSGNAVDSRAAKITIKQELKITKQPVSKTVALGNSLTLSVEAEGDGLTYQWYFKKSGQTAWSKWNGHTHASETCTPNDTWNGIQLYCEVSDAYGNWLDSDIVRITVTQGVRITTQPTGKTVTLGSSVTLSLKAEGNGLTYQWYYKKAGQSSFSAWNGHTHASETVTPNESWNGIQLYCKVKDASGNAVNSNTITVTVNQVLKITTQPTGKTIQLGGSVTLSLKAQGSGLTYQWYFKKAGQTSFSAWNGRTHASETVTPNESWNGIRLYCKVKDASGKTVTSDTVQVLFSDVITVVTQPANVSTKVGSDVTFSVKAVGVGLTYQWQYKKAGASAWSAWSSRTAASTTATANASWNGMQVRCVIKNSAGKSVASNAAKITVTGLITVTQQPKNVTAGVGEDVAFIVKASGSGTLTYQWYYKKAGASEWSKWNGRTTACTVATANASWNGMQVRCVISDSAGNSVTSSAAKITIN